MPLVVSSLTGDALDMFNWTCSVSPGGTQDLSELLQMLREHYCGSFTFQEQRNMVKNLCQGAREDATDFMIRVGSSIGNLAKDWKGQIMEAELKSLQYKVSLNRVREEIRHVLDSEIARHSQLTPHQMYKVVKKYETYVAHNKCLEGKVGISGIMVDPEGFVMMNVKIPCVKGYNEDQIAIVMDDLGMKDCPVILGMPTIFQVMEVIKESEISKLAVPWASSRVSWLMRGVHARMSQLAVDNVANKAVAPLSVDEVVRVSHKCKVPPFGHKVIHGSVGLVLQGYRMNLMTHGLEKRSPLLPLGIDIQSAYATLAAGSNRVAVVLRNNT